jgi:hypothetical protein
MKMTAATVVNFDRNPIAPALPKIVWLAPPKAAPNSAPFPAWRRTIKTRAKQTITCKTVMIVSIRLFPFWLIYSNFQYYLLNNLNLEIRISKSETISKFKSPNFPNEKALSFVFRSLEFVSNFGFRASDFWSILISHFSKSDNLGEGIGFQACPSNQRPINILLRHQTLNIFRGHAPTILNPYSLCNLL